MIPGYLLWTGCAVTVSTLCTSLTAYLAWKVFQDTKDDEQLFFGDCHHAPTITSASHACTVVCTNIFNKSRRKAYIEEVKATENGSPVDIDWGTAISELGAICSLGQFGITDCGTLYVCKQEEEDILCIELEVTYRIRNRSETKQLKFAWFQEEEPSYD